MRRFLVVVAMAVLMAACGGGNNGSPSTSASTATSSSRGSTSTTTAAGLSGYASTEVSVPAPPNGPGRTALLSAVRAAAQDGFDRVTFEFEGTTMPGYRIAYQDPPILEDGSGRAVSVKGGAVLVAHFEPASGADLSGSTMRQTYTGPTDITPATTTILEVVRTGDFEAHLAWAIGVSAKRPFKVTTLTNPARVVIDVAQR